MAKEIKIEFFYEDGTTMVLNSNTDIVEFRRSVGIGLNILGINNRSLELNGKILEPFVKTDNKIKDIKILFTGIEVVSCDNNIKETFYNCNYNAEQDILYEYIESIL